MRKIVFAVLFGALAGAFIRADGESDNKKPVRVYILSGQSNMVGMGDVSGGGVRWGDEFMDPVVSVYEGSYDPAKDYDKLEPINTLKLESFGGVSPTPYPEGGTQVLRGYLQPKAGGVYEFRPGYGASTENIMEVDGKEVYRKEPGKDSTHTLIKLEEGKKVSFKITYLNQNANGLGWWVRTDIPGTLQTLVTQQGKFTHLIDENGKWSKRDDVIYKGVVSDTWSGPLTVADNSIGPELGFGHIVGDEYDEPVLLIKASIGNRSLGWDILPPNSKRYTFEGKVYAGYKDSPASWPVDTKPEPINWYAGKTYDRYTEEINKVLDNFDTLYPQFKDRGYKVAGFVWWQGHKDGGSQAHINHYEENMVNLIESWRKEFKAKDAPWVIATVGFYGDKMAEKVPQYVQILEAQMAVADPEKHSDLKGTVKTVDTRPFWRDEAESPRSQYYHYHRNAETYYLVGEAAGKAMLELESYDE